MRELIYALLLIPGAVVAAPDPAYLPLEFLAGHCWKGAFPGGKQTDEHCFAWVYGGKFLRDRHVVHAEGRPDALGESIYFYDSAAKQLQYLYIESDGGFSRGPVSIDKDSLVFPDTSFVEKGKTLVYRSRWQHGADNTYDVLTEFKSGDSWVPGFKIHMLRGAEAKAEL
jgi:hypothetical protein